MAFLYPAQGPVESGRRPSLAVRVTGLIIAFFALTFVFAHLRVMLREDPFRGHALQRTKAVITGVTPGQSKGSFRSYPGYYFHYQFVLGEDRHTGEFFVRSNRYYQVGHEIDVVYRVDHPDINCIRPSHSNDAPLDTLQSMGYLFVALYGLLGIVGLIMLCTGKDILKRRTLS
ncbi:MAG TPA: hypothetical protein PLX97_07135 [Gemmatales bacterium]|nr:hypothetical protein [Gemmatales bacterium]